VSLLDRKLLRDLNAMRAQVITIALLVASGVAVFVGSVSTYQSLRAGSEQYYQEARFPQVFVIARLAASDLDAAPRNKQQDDIGNDSGARDNDADREPFQVVKRS